MCPFIAVLIQVKKNPDWSCQHVFVRVRYLLIVGPNEKKKNLEKHMTMRMTSVFSIYLLVLKLMCALAVSWGYVRRDLACSGTPSWKLNPKFTLKLLASIEDLGSILKPRSNMSRKIAPRLTPHLKRLLSLAWLPCIDLLISYSLEVVFSESHL